MDKEVRCALHRIPLEKPLMKESVGVVVVNYCNYWDTINFISKLLLRQQGIDLHIAIVDNASPNESVEVLTRVLKAVENVTIIISESNGGYASGNNLGIAHLMKHCRCRYIIVANSDIECDNPWLIYKLINRCGKLDCLGFIAPLMLEDGAISPNSAWRLPTALSEVLNSMYCLKVLFHWYLGKFPYRVNECDSSEIAVDCVSGSFFLGTPEVFEKVGYLDEGTFLYYEETILGHKVKQVGLTNYLAKDLVYHHKGARSIDGKYSTSGKYAVRLQSKLYYWRTYHKTGCLFSILLRILHWCNLGEIRLLRLYRGLLSLC